MGQPLSCSAADAGLWREAMVMAPPLRRDSAVWPCFLGCPDFLYRHFPPQSPSSHPFNPSLHSQQQPLPWGCSKIPKLQLLATVPFGGPASLSGACMATAKDCLIFIPFRLPQIICLTFSLKCFSSGSDKWPDVGLWTLASVPPPAEGRSSPTDTPVFPLVPSTKFCVVLYIFFLWSGIPVCSQLVFCMRFCVWRCIPDVSVERGILHFHLLLRHLVLLWNS